MKNKKWFLNGGRGSGRTIRFLCEIYENRISELEKRNADIIERLSKVEDAYRNKFDAEWKLNGMYQKLKTDYANAERCSREYFTRYREQIERIEKIKETLKAFDNCEGSYTVINRDCVDVRITAPKILLEQIRQSIKD